MISKQDLADYELELKKLKYNLKRAEDNIRKEKSKQLSDSVSGSNPHFPYEERHFVVTGVSDLRLTKLRKQKRNAERRIEKFDLEKGEKPHEKLRIYLPQFSPDLLEVLPRTEEQRHACAGHRRLPL